MFNATLTKAQPQDIIMMQNASIKGEEISIPVHADSAPKPLKSQIAG